MLCALLGLTAGKTCPMRMLSNQEGFLGAGIWCETASSIFRASVIFAG